MMKITWTILMSIGYDVTNEEHLLTYFSTLTYEITNGKQALTCLPYTNFDVFFFYRKRKTRQSLFSIGYLICQNKKNVKG